MFDFYFFFFRTINIILEMPQKCCSKEGFVAVSKLYNFHDKKLRNLLVEHAESTTRSRVGKKFVPVSFSVLSRKFYNDLNKDFISKYLLVVFVLSFIHSCWLEHDYLVNPKQL